MEPRIYVYRITFVDQPYWYWGWHKERKFDEYYMGSPVTNKRYWEMFEPIKEIVEIFDYSEEGEVLAQLRENELIKPDLNNPLCLNEHYGGIVSSKVLSESAKKLWSDSEYREKVSNHLVEMNIKNWNNPDYYLKMLPRLIENQKKMIQEALSEESRRKRLETFSLIGHQKGEKNSQFGKMWITDGTKEGSLTIKKGDEIPEGYRPGRVCK